MGMGKKKKSEIAKFEKSVRTAFKASDPSSVVRASERRAKPAKRAKRKSIFRRAGAAVGGAVTRAAKALDPGSVVRKSETKKKPRRKRVTGLRRGSSVTKKGRK